MKKILLLLGIVLMLSACSNLKAEENKRPFVHVKDYPMILEYSASDEKLILQESDVLTSNSDVKWLLEHPLQIEDLDIRLNQVGSYEVHLSFKDSDMMMIFDVIIQDTVAPDLQVQDVNIEQDTTIDINSFVVSASDLSGIKELKFTTDVDLVSVGTRTYQVVAIDNNGLETIKEVNLTINEKVVSTYQAPANNWSSGTSASNGGGSSNPIPSQPQQTTTLTPMGQITHSTKESCEIDLQKLFDKQGGAGGCNAVYARENGTLMGWQLFYVPR